MAAISMAAITKIGGPSSSSPLSKKGAPITRGAHAKATRSALHARNAAIVSAIGQ